MIKLPDYSEFLDKEGMLQYIESEWQKNKHIHEHQASIINELIAEFDNCVLLEVGSSTGNLAKLLHECFYTGVEKHKPSIALAEKKNPTLKFKNSDVRKMKFKNDFDIVCAFAFMKHFGLHEWNDILKVLAECSSKYVVFDMPSTDKEDPFDDGEFYNHHHVWMPEDEVEYRAKKLGLTLVNIDNQNAIEPVYIFAK